MTGVLTKRTACYTEIIRRGTWREDSHVKVEAKIQIMLPAAKECLMAWEVGRDEEESFPRCFRRDTAPSSPGFGVSKLQNHDTINFCCSKPPSLWYYITEALGN